MENYVDKLNKKIQKYYEILSDEFPSFLHEYIHTEQMQKQAKISVSCGTIYSKMYNQMWYSSLDHSIGVSLIIWNFTKDKKQTLAGLFHDISTPVFKHSIDFLNNDYEKQESTEQLTKKTIQESHQIMELLKRDGIKIDEVSNYHIYPIADNDTPKLSSDRLEYTLSNSLGATKELLDLDEVRQIYKNIEIQKNEENQVELGFKDVKIAEKFVNVMSILSKKYICNKTLFSMQMLSDILKIMLEKNEISLDELYSLSEKEIIEKIKMSKVSNISKCFKRWQEGGTVYISDVAPCNKYFVNIKKVKKRYINPLVKVDNEFVRIKDISKKANNDINEVLNFKFSNYIFMDFDLNLNQ